MGRNLEEFIKKNFKKAIDNFEIQPFYQPVIRVLSRQLCSFEALARWIDPELGMIIHLAGQLAGNVGKQGGLAAAVGAYDAGHAAFFHVKGDVMQYFFFAYAVGQIFYR